MDENIQSYLYILKIYNKCWHPNWPLVNNENITFSPVVLQKKIEPEGVQCRLVEQNRRENQLMVTMRGDWLRLVESWLSIKYDVTTVILENLISWAKVISFSSYRISFVIVHRFTKMHLHNNTHEWDYVMSSIVMGRTAIKISFHIHFGYIKYLWSELNILAVIFF